VDYLTGFNVNAIVIELPSSMIENGAPGKFRHLGHHQASNGSPDAERKDRSIMRFSALTFRGAWAGDRFSLVAVTLAATGCRRQQQTGPSGPRMCPTRSSGWAIR